MKITRIPAALSFALGALALLWGGQAFAQSALSQDNRSISVATGNTYQAIAPADGTRRMVEIENNNATDNCLINVDAVVAAGQTTASNVTNSAGSTITAAKASVLLLPGGSYTRYYPYVPLGPIVGTCTTAGDSLYVGIH